MKKQADTNYVKTKVVMEFADGEQAEAFFRLFAESLGEAGKKFKMIAACLPDNAALKKVDSVKELKHNYYIKMA